MIRALLYVLAIVATAVGLSWLADRPGELVINWQGYEVQTSVFRAIVLAGLMGVAAIMVWSVVRQVLTSPATVGHFFRRRRQERGLEALSSGLIAVGSGDRALARRYATEAHRSLPHEPLTQLLRAQSAQLSGDRATARRIYEAMCNNPDTELLGLRGLYLEAQQENEPEAARQFAERAVTLNPRLGWSVESLFAMQCKDADWPGALETLGTTQPAGRTVAEDEPQIATTRRIAREKQVGGQRAHTRQSQKTARQRSGAYVDRRRRRRQELCSLEQLVYVDGRNGQFRIDGSLR